MPAKVSRSRSNTVASNASSRQTKSRASTTSDQSVASQPSHDLQQASQASFHVQSQAPATIFQDTPEELIARSSQQFTNPNNHYAIDPSLQNNESHVTGYHPESNLDHTVSTTRPPMNPYHSFDGKENQCYDGIVEDQAHEGNVTGDGSSRRKKGAATSQANDNELRKLFRENSGRPLDEIAAQVVENERGPKSEKTKQIFAMLWLSSSCKKSSGSVPRNRVFSHYATRCGTERVPPLNPASFGKLVRIIFPGIQTRRLGIRGESKYHYVELSLENDQQDLLDTQRMHSTIGASYGIQGVETRDSRMHKLDHPTDTALFPPSGAPRRCDLSAGACRHGIMDSGGLYLSSSTNDAAQISHRTNMLHRELKFPKSEVSKFPDNELLELPNIDPYLPSGADPDAVRSLTSVYRSHCNLAIENFRFCKRKDFWQSYTSLLGLLTVPGQKLLAQPSIATWIRECDWLKYQKMMSIVQVLALTKNHPKATRHMENVATELRPFILLTFQNQPHQIQDAMLGPATIFVNLLERMSNVNQSAQAAADVLTNDANREGMWNEWMMHVKPLQIVQSTLCGNGYTRVLQILTQEIRELLSPTHSSASLDANTIFAKQSVQFPTTLHRNPHLDADDEFTENHLDRWVNFLHSLPSRFPGLEARLLLNFSDVIGNAALRDLSRSASPSLGGWWTIKMFLDETIHWLAEKGGFLENGPESMRMRGETSRVSAQVASEAFEMVGRDEVFGNSRPRTAASASVDAPSRFSSVDAGPNLNHAQSLDGDASEIGPRNGSRDQGQYVPNEVTDISHGFPDNNSRHQSVAQHSQDGKNQHSRHGSTITDIPVDSRMFHASDIGHVPSHDDSGIGMGLEDDEFASEKYSGFVENGIHGSDPADVVVC